MKYYFYIVRCSDNSLYCGVTNNLERRVKEHNSQSIKSAKYTRAHAPVFLVYREEYENKSLAMKREYQVKQWSKQKKEALVNSL
jgi:putative endonuclease